MSSLLSTVPSLSVSSEESVMEVNTPSPTPAVPLKVVEDKAQRILEAAKLLFARFGIKKTSIEEIAHQAGLGKGTVYLYFKSKDEIFSVLANNFAKEFNDGLDAALSSSGSAAERLKAYIETRVRFWDRCFREYGMTTSTVMEFQASAVADDIRKQYSANQLRVLTDLLQEGKSQGAFNFDNVEVAALGVFHVLDALTRPWSIDHESISADDKIKTTTALLFNGLVARS